MFLLDIGSSWSLNVNINIHLESGDDHDTFFEGNPDSTNVILTLTSYPDMVVLAIGTIKIHPRHMAVIKEACFA